MDFCEQTVKQSAKINGIKFGNYKTQKNNWFVSLIGSWK